MSPTIAQDAKRSAIIIAGTAAFTRDGFATTRIGDIATAAGVGKGTVYEYFASKEDLLVACCLARCLEDRRAIRALLEHRLPDLAQLVPVDDDSAQTDVVPPVLPADPAAALRTVLATALSHLLATPDQDQRLFLDLMTLARERPDLRTQVQPHIVAVLERWESLVGQLIDAGIAAAQFRPHPDVPALCRVLTATVDGLLIQRAWRGDDRPDLLAVRITDTVLATLLVSPKAN